MPKDRTSAAVIERKARPIYESLNRGDFKVSIKQCNQALSKHPDNNLFKILKALAHDRLSNCVEASQLVRDIIESGETDDEVLHHCSNLLKRWGDYDDLLELYKAASAAEPHDLGLLQELFLAHVRAGNVLEQQQLAMKINKAVPGELQTFWVVCSMLTQADKARSGEGKGMSAEMLLKLASGLINKHLQREEGISYDGIIVYLDILLSQGNYQSCTELLDGPCARAVQIPHELLRLKAQTALVSKDQAKAKEILMESLRSMIPDDWAGYMLLFACCLPSTALPFDQAAEGIISLQGGFGGLQGVLEDSEHWSSMQPGPEATEEDYKEACSELEAFLSSIISKVEAGDYDSMQTGRLRGPYLAQVDLALRRYRLRLDSASVLAAAMLAYFKRFRNKLVVPQDLRKYAIALPRETAVWLAASLAEERRALSSEASGKGGWTMQRIQIAASCLRIERHLGHPVCTSPSEAIDHSHACMQLFVQWIPSMKGCDERETLVGEQAAEHAVISCMQAFRLSGKIPFLVQAMVQLRLAIKLRPYSAALRLSLAGLQWLLGNADAALSEFRALSIRQVQLDSLSHHILPALVQCGSAKHESFFSSVRRVRSECEGSMLEAITECYKNGTYTKVPEFLAFRRRAARSRTFLEATCEQGLLQLRTALVEGLAVTTKVQQAAKEIHQRVKRVVVDDNECFHTKAGHCAPEDSTTNEDLSQLPQWLPPVACTSVHGALDWWQAAARGSPSADAEAGAPWWTLPRASTSDVHEAHAWRDSRSNAVAFRISQLQLMATLFCQSDKDKAAPLPNESSQETLVALSAAAGLSGVTMHEWHASQDWSVARSYLHGTVAGAQSGPGGTLGEAKKPFVTSDLLQKLTILTLAWGVDMNVLLQNGTRTGVSQDAANSADGNGMEASDVPGDPQQHRGAVGSAAAASHAKFSVSMLDDILATLTLNVLGGLQLDTAAALPPDGDGSNVALIDGVTLHCVQLLAHHAVPLLAALCVVLTSEARHNSSHASKGGHITVAEAIDDVISSISRVCTSIKKVCTDLARSIRECRLVCSDVYAPTLGVAQRAKRILEMMSDEKQTAEAFQGIVTQQRGLLTAAATVLDRSASMCSACTRCIAQ